MEFNWIRLVSLIVFTATDVGVAVYQRYIKNEFSRTSYAAHFFGAIAGFFIGINFLRNLKVQRWETILGWIVLVIYFVLVVSAIIFNVAHKDYFPKNEPNSICYMQTAFWESQDEP